MSGLIGKFLYFWIFIIGALMVLKFSGYAGDNRTMAIVIGAIAVVYIVWNVFREMGKRRKEEKKAAAYRQPVKKGASNKKRKR